MNDLQFGVCTALPCYELTYTVLPCRWESGQGERREKVERVRLEERVRELEVEVKRLEGRADKLAGSLETVRHQVRGEEGGEAEA